MISPLDQLYIDTTSKEDMLAEILDLRKMLTDARGEWSKADRELQELRKVSVMIAELQSTVKRQAVAISKYRKRLGDSDAGGIKRAVFSLIAEGLTNQEIIDKGYNKQSVQRYRRLYNTIKKAA